MKSNFQEYTLVYIGFLSICIAISGLTALFFVYFGIRFKWLEFMTIVHFRDLPLLSNFFGSHMMKSVSAPTLAFYIIMLAGGIIYNKTKGSDSRLLRFSYVTLTICYVVSLLTKQINHNYTKKLATKYIEMQDVVQSNWELIFSYTNTIILLVLFIVIGRILQENQGSYKDQTLENSDNNFQVNRASKLQRFIHFIFDTLLFLYIMLPSIGIIIDHYAGSIMITYYISAGTILGIIAYYLICEGIFMTSPIKCLTGTRIVTNGTTRPSFKSILLRTLCRRIPFEPISFFGKNGWHDLIPKLKVVCDDDNGLSRSYHKWWIALLPFCYLISYGSGILNKFLETGKKEKFSNSLFEKEMQKKFEILDTNSYLSLSDQNQQYFARYIEEDGDYIIALIKPSNQDRSDKSIVSLFSDTSSVISDTIRLEREITKQAFLNEEPIQIGNVPMNISGVRNLGEPDIRIYGGTSKMTSSGRPFSFRLETRNYPITITKIKTVNGSFSWKTSLPIGSKTMNTYNNYSLTLKGTMFDEKISNEAEITLICNDIEMKYLLINSKLGRKLYRIK